MLRNVPLKWVLFGLVALCVSAPVVFQILYFPAQQARQSLGALNSKGQTMAELLAHNLQASFEFEDTEGASRILEAAKKDSDFISAVVIDAKGDVFTAIEASESGLLADVKRVEKTTLKHSDNQLRVLTPIDTEMGGGGTLALLFSLERVLQEQQQSQTDGITLGLVILALGVVAAYGVGQFVSRPVQRMTEVLESLADGDLTQSEVETSSSNEIGAMAGSFNRMLRELRRIVSDLRTASSELSTSAEQILVASQEQEQGSTEQTGSIEEISRSISGVADTARTIAERSQSLVETADQMQTNMQRAQETVATARDGMAQIVKQQDVIAERINHLYEQTQSVINVVDVIDDISDRLDLLALNAALEGSRAGEVGKGFSLVAQEMRRLAENVLGSTKQIKDTIQEIQRSTQNSLEASQEGSRIIGDGAAEMERMTTTIGQVFELIDKSTEASKSIGMVTQQQVSSTEQTAQAMQEMGKIAHQSLESAQEVTRTASALAELSVTIRETAATFRLQADEGKDAQTKVENVSKAAN